MDFLLDILLKILLFICILCGLALYFIMSGTSKIYDDRGFILSKEISLILGGTIKKYKPQHIYHAFDIKGFFNNYSISVNIFHGEVSISTTISDELPKQDLFMLEYSADENGVVRMGQTFKISFQDIKILENDVFAEAAFLSYLNTLIKTVNKAKIELSSHISP